VAILFAGIFVTMIAPLLLLNEHGRELGLARPWQFFWATGLLSSFLDNAPTYLTFASAASGLFGVSVEGSRYLAELLARGPAAIKILEAISCGAVFMGANTYIGNGPNFMVKAIAEENGVKMPSFFGYMAYSRHPAAVVRAGDGAAVSALVGDPPQRATMKPSGLYTYRVFYSAEDGEYGRPARSFPD
jgi:Na+/H+ antiporter NhaD/arsenite permease-like protein